MIHSNDTYVTLARSQPMLKSLVSFQLACKQFLRDIFFNLGLPDHLQRVHPMKTSLLKQFDPVLAQLVNQPDSPVQVFYSNNILMKIIIQKQPEQAFQGGMDSFFIDQLRLSFKTEFKSYCELNEDIITLLHTNNYYQLRIPQCCYLEHLGITALAVAMENLSFTQLTLQDQLPSLQYEEQRKLERELNPSKKDFEDPLNPSPNTQDDTTLTDDKKYKDKLNKYVQEQMNRSDANFANPFEANNSNNNNNNRIELNPSVNISQIFSTLTQYQRLNNRRMILNGMGMQDFFIYQIDDSCFDNFKEIDSTEDIPSKYPKHFKIILLQFKLYMSNGMLSQLPQFDFNPSNQSKWAFLKDLQDLKVATLTQKRFKEQLKKYKLSSYHVSDLLKQTSDRMQLPKQYLSLMLVSPIIKRKFSEYLMNRLEVFRISIIKVQDKIVEIKQTVKQQEEVERALELQFTQIISEQRRMREKYEEQLSLQIEDGGVSESVVAIHSRYKQLQEGQLNLKPVIEKVKNQLKEMKFELYTLVQGDPEEKEFDVVDYSKSPQQSNGLLKNKSSLSLSLSFSLVDIEANNLETLQSKMQLFIVKSVREFLIKILFEDQFWKNEIIAELTSKDCPIVKRDDIPTGLLLQEICNEFSILCKPQARVIEDRNGFLLRLNPMVKVRQVIIRSSYVHKLISDFNENLENNFLNICSSAIKILENVLQIHNEFEPEKNKSFNDSIQSISKKDTSKPILDFNISLQKRKLNQEICVKQMQLLYTEQRFDQIFDMIPQVNTMFFNLETEKHPVLQIIFQAYLSLGQIENAKTIFDQMRKIIVYNFGAENILLICGLEEIGNFYIRKQAYKEGIQIYERCQQICLNSIGYNHPKTALCSSVLAELNLKTNNIQKSIDCYNASLDQYIDHHNDHYKSILGIHQKLSTIYSLQNNHEESYKSAVKGEEYYNLLTQESVTAQDPSIDILFLRLTFQALKAMVNRNDFKKEKISHHTNTFWFCCQVIQVDQHRELIGESLLLSLILGLYHIEYKHRQIFIQLLEDMETAAANSEQELATAPPDNAKEQETVDLFMSFVLSLPTFEDLIYSITQDYYEAATASKPPFKYTQYVKTKSVNQDITLHHHILTVMTILETLRYMLGSQNIRLFFMYDFIYGKFL